MSSNNHIEALPLTTSVLLWAICGSHWAKPMFYCGMCWSLWGWNDNNSLFQMSLCLSAIYSPFSKEFFFSHLAIDVTDYEENLDSIPLPVKIYAQRATLEGCTFPFPPYPRIGTHRATAYSGYFLISLQLFRISNEIALTQMNMIHTSSDESAL